jgi:putative holliday junction resolvase
MSEKAQRLLGIDLGTKFIGLAIGDSDLKIATGLDVVEFKGNPEFLDILRGIIKEYEIDLVVLGLPLNMDGSEGNKAKEAKEIADKIRSGLNIKVELIDEGLTTDQAIRELHAGDGKVGKQKEKINMIAAAIILQNYIDNLPPDIL